MAAARERPVARTPREEIAVSAERGAVTVEAALATCSLAVVLALAIGALAVMVAQLRCQDAAGIAARLAARGEQGRAEVAVRRVAPVGASLTLRVQGDEIEALVEAAPLGGLVPPVKVTARAYAVAEPDVPTGRPAGPPPAPRPEQASAPDTAAPPSSTPPVTPRAAGSGRDFPASSRAGSEPHELHPAWVRNSPGAGRRGRRGADRWGSPSPHLGTRPRGVGSVPPDVRRAGAVGGVATHALRAGPKAAGERSPPGTSRRAASRTGDHGSVRGEVGQCCPV
ncbi:TadE family type IV pilus minor pilin [Actinoalloteichus caeruleus]|uniref:TadE family type IV pilus minor pilin n=1 Tax=Actinoalloteichus cyanogriseus TaxID=2893586 RepID=UPI002FFB43ED